MRPILRSRQMIRGTLREPMCGEYPTGKGIAATGFCCGGLGETLSDTEKSNSTGCQWRKSTRILLKQQQFPDDTHPQPQPRKRGTIATPTQPPSPFSPKLTRQSPNPLNHTNLPLRPAPHLLRLLPLPIPLIPPTQSPRLCIHHTRIPQHRPIPKVLIHTHNHLGLIHPYIHKF